MWHAYVRVSRPHQVMTGLSLEAQAHQLRAYVVAQGAELAGVYVDAAVSGAYPLAERPGGKRMLAGLQAGDVVIVSKLDRMSRSARDALETLDSLKKRRVALHSLDMGGDVTGTVGRLILTVLSAVAEMERERISERIKDAKAELRRQGRHQGGKAPFGWSIGAGNVLEPIAEEQGAIAAMRGDRLAGLSYNAIGAAHGMDQKTVWRILRDADREAPK